MELRQLRYFVAVAEELNFTKAAARLRVAQPALSRQIQGLEDELGVDLFTRSPRGVTLTAEGKLLLEEARDLIRRAEQAAFRVQALARGDDGVLQIGYAPSLAVEVLPPALAAFQAAAPKVKLVLHDMTSNEMVAGLRDGSLDLAIMVGPLEENAAGLAFAVLKQYPFWAAMPATHPLAKLETVPIARMLDEPLVTLRQKDYSDFHRYLLQLFTGQTGSPRIAVESDSGSSLIAEVQAGRGVALLPEVYRQTIGSRLQMRPLSPGHLTPLEMVAAYAKKNPPAPAADKFLKLLHRMTRPTSG